jgi:DNA repair protein RecN (Recombination protein N)
VLRELHIRDFAIIDTLQLTLEPGFNILTGETGAGKSILIDAVALLLGGRADVTMIRSDTERAVVEGMFALRPEQQQMLAPLLEREGVESESADTLWLSREVRASGRSVARVNGAVVSVALLREVAEALVDIHGQSEHLSLLRVQEHLTLLDRFAGLMVLRQQVAAEVGQLHAVRRELTNLRKGERERMQRVDLLRFQVQEIYSAALRPDELSELEEERVRLANAEQLASLGAALLALLQEGEGETPAALDLLGQAQREMNTLSRVDTALEPEAKALEEVIYQVEDLARALRTYRQSIEFSPKRLAQVEERLGLLRQLERKYGGDIAGVLAYAERAAAELEVLEHSDERIAELEGQEAGLLATCAALCEELSRKRRDAAHRLAAGVEGELEDLRMQGTRFAVAFHHREDAGGLPLADPLPREVWVASEGESVQDGTPVGRAAFDVTGMDTLEFLVAPNVGEGLKPMARIASGGETARLMLALKTVLSRADYIPTLIFDEIDQGIGGRVGAVVGAKLWRLTVDEGGEAAHQVLCITHLPQLAGFGDAHYRVQKIVTAGRTVTEVARLLHEERLAELAQMLGTEGGSALQGAGELLEQSERMKTHTVEGDGVSR